MSSTTPTCTYVTNGHTFTLTFNENYDTWGTQFNDVEVVNKSLSNLKLALDRRTSPAAEKTRIACLYSPYGTSTAVEVVATSTQRKGGQVRITKPAARFHNKASWEYVQRDYLFEPSAANREIIAQRDALQKQAQELQEQVRALAKKLTRADVSELDKYAE